MINSSKITTVLFTISLTVILFSCKEKTKSTTDETYTAKQEVDWTQAHEYYLQHIKKTHQYLDSLNQTSPNFIHLIFLQFLHLNIKYKGIVIFI